MGQYKYEKEFGEKLNQREIEPSAGSWEKLQSNLDSSKKKRFAGFKWAGIAAAIIAGIMVVGILNYDSISEAPAVVDSPVKKIRQETPQVVEEKREQVPVKAEPRQALVNPRKTSIVKRETSVIAEAETEKEAVQNSEDKTVNDLVESDNFSKTEEAIAQTAPSEKTEVTDAEVEALLAKARAQINTQRTSNVVSVDAKDLLWNVEMEMEQSFREKVFDVLKEGFDKAKTAVVNGNY